MSRRALIGSGLTAAVAGGLLLSRGRGGSSVSSTSVSPVTTNLADAVIDLRGPVAGSVDEIKFLTPADDFFLIDTVGKAYPRVDAAQWSLRIHGMVDREVTLTMNDLAKMPFVENVVTLGCVSNEVGGDLVGNAKWGGVLLADVLKMAGVSPAAEQLASTSADGWTCGTPVSAVLDGRPAMLATHMNGEPLTGEHGYPVRMIVPGLFGFVSATKWVTDIELTTWDAFTPFWLARGWARESPMLASSRIDVPRDLARVPVGPTIFGGVAWAPRAGVGSVEVRIDGGEWSAAEIVESAGGDAWVIWRAEVRVEEGNHSVAVRVIDAAGVAQVEEVRDVLTAGATGLHEISVSGV